MSLFVSETYLCCWYSWMCPFLSLLLRIIFCSDFFQHGNYVIVMNLLKRVSRFGGRTQKFLMKCPAVLAPPNREYIQCDSDFIQVRIEWCDKSFFFFACSFFSIPFFFYFFSFAFKVTREIPVDNWNNEVISNKCVDMWDYEEMNVSNVEYFWCDFSIQLDWSLALSGSLVVALEDSSLIQVNVEMHKPNITVQGRRDTILSPVQVRLCQFVAGRICNSL